MNQIFANFLLSGGKEKDLCSLKRRIGISFSLFAFEMATEKTCLLLAIARRRLFVKEITTRHAKFKLTKRIIELARRA